MGMTRALKGGLATVFVAAGAAAMPHSASAGTDVLPGGSWRQSCDKAYVRDGMLHASCRRDGSTNRHEFATIQIGSCQAFGNRNGTLFCESTDGNGAMGQWSGSFRDSCRDFSVNRHGKLQATCRKENGDYKRSNLAARKCRAYRAGNQNGTLVCESSGGGSGNADQWDGSFRNSCRDVSVDSNGTLKATCQTMSGNWSRSGLSPRQCNESRAGNRDGNLVCER
jgi:CVNH domain